MVEITEIIDESQMVIEPQVSTDNAVVEETVVETDTIADTDAVETVVESQPVERIIDFHDADPYPQGKVGFPEEQNKNNTTDTIGLEDELPESIVQELKAEARRNLEARDAFNIDKNLNEDIDKVPDQNFVVVSFVGPTFTAKTDINGFRVMGAFATIEEATEYIVDLEDKTYDTGVVEMYKFVPSVPYTDTEHPRDPKGTDGKTTQDQVDNFLNDIIVKHKVEREESRLIFEYRKDKLMQNKHRFVEKELPKAEGAEGVSEAGEADRVVEAGETVDAGETVRAVDVKAPETSIASSEISEMVNEAKTPAPRNKTHARLLKKIMEKKEILREQINPRKRLTASKAKIDNQNYVVIAFVGNTGNNNRIVMKIKGCFNTYEECQEFCKEAHDIESSYDLLVAEMYNWLPCDPNVNDIKQVHDDEQLNNFIDTAVGETKVINKIKNNFDVFDHKEQRDHTQRDSHPLQIPQESFAALADLGLGSDANAPEKIGKARYEELIKNIESNVTRTQLDGTVRK
jgi:hypothetical protein